MIWQAIFPLPTLALSPNHAIHRRSKEQCEKQYKKDCAEIWDTCPVRHALHVRLSMEWYCLRDPDKKAQPKPGKLKPTKIAIGRQPYTPRDVANAWAAAKYLIDAMCDRYNEVKESYIDANGRTRTRTVSKSLEAIGVIKDDSFRYFKGGPCDVFLTEDCKKRGITEPGIKIVIEIAEAPSLEL